MASRKSLPFQIPGRTGRRTGLAVLGTPTRGANGVEDLDSFYISDEDVNEITNTGAPPSPLKRLGELARRREKEENSENRGPNSPQQQPNTTSEMSVNNGVLDTTTKANLSKVSSSHSSQIVTSDSDSDLDASITVAERLEPILLDADIKKIAMGSKFTREMALGGGPRREFGGTSKEADSYTDTGPTHDAANEQTKKVGEANEEDVKETIVKDPSSYSSPKLVNQSSLATKEVVDVVDVKEDHNSEGDYVTNYPIHTPSLTPKKTSPLMKKINANATTKVKTSVEKIQAKVTKTQLASKSPVKTPSKTKTSAKAVHAESPVRRSTRHRVAPVASWRNEKLAYRSEKVNGVWVKTLQPQELSENEKEQDEKEQNEKEQNEKGKRSKRTSKGSNRDVNDEKREDIEEDVVDAAKEEQKEEPPLESAIVPKPRKRGRPPKLSVERSTKETQNQVVEPAPKRRRASTKLKKEAKESKKAKPTKLTAPAATDAPTVGLQPEEVALPAAHGDDSIAASGSVTIPVFEGPGTGTQVQRVVAWSPGHSKNTKHIQSAEEKFTIHTLFDMDSEFCGAGTIEIEAGNRKAVKSNNDTYFIFHVMGGTLAVSINNFTFSAGPGTTFEIPMGNYYQFVNNGADTARLLFVQAKYVVIGESDEESETDSESEQEDDSQTT